MAVDLTGKPVCITGASAGIGRAAAVLCAQAGMPVLAAARREDRLRAVVEQIEAAGGRAVAARVDVDSPDDCARMIERCLDAFGSVYSVFANAGYGLTAPVHETPDHDLRAIFETNFFGTVNTIRPALPHMLERAEGHILINSSCIGKFAVRGHGAYCATKGAQWLLGRSMAYELRPRGVRVSTVHPIGTRTEFFDVAATRSGDEPQRSAGAADRFKQPPETVARAIVRCLRRPRSEVWTSTTIRLFAALATAWPSLGDAALRNRGS